MVTVHMQKSEQIEDIFRGGVSRTYCGIRRGGYGESSKDGWWWCNLLKGRGNKYGGGESKSC